MTTPMAVGQEQGLAEELQDLYRRTKAQVGDEDLAPHPKRQRVRTSDQGSPDRAVGRRETGGRGPWAVILEMLYRLLQFSELGHNIIHGSYDHLPNCGEYHSERYQWDFNVDLRQWKVMHHEGHHPHTNIAGRDHDLGYSISRAMAGQDWFGHHILQTALIGVLAATAPQSAPFLLGNVTRHVEGQHFFSWQTLSSPIGISLRDAQQRYLREPLGIGLKGLKFLPALAANYLGGVAGYMSVFFLVAIEHHAGELEMFPDPGPDETPNQYYARQYRATRNFVRSPGIDTFLQRILTEEVPFQNRPDFRIFYGGLDTHIEHHMFPDLPPNRQREIAPAVRAIAARHGLPYHETPLLESMGLFAKAMTGLSIPMGELEFGKPLRLLAQPVSLLRRLAFGAAYKPLPEAPYLDKPRFFNVPVKVLSANSIARGQAVHVRLQKPRGWDDIRWDAGAFVSVRVEVDDEALVRQYSLVHDSDSSDAMEICVKRVPDGRVSNRLNDILRAGKYVTLVGVPANTGGMAMTTVPRKSLFIAGGVGITPIISQLRMIAREAPGSDAVLLYFNRDDRSIIFERELRRLAEDSGVQVHFFTDKASRRRDITEGQLSQILLKRYVRDVAERDTFVCAPPAMVDQAQRDLRGLGLDPGRFHTESFTPPSLDRPADDGRRYVVRFRRSEQSVEIDGATTLLEAATQAGIRVPTGCQRGLCGACISPKLSGATQLEADHGPMERITVCNSLACSDIDLDL